MIYQDKNGAFLPTFDESLKLVKNKLLNLYEFIMKFQKSLAGDSGIRIDTPILNP